MKKIKFLLFLIIFSIIPCFVMAEEDIDFVIDNKSYNSNIIRINNIVSDYNYEIYFSTSKTGKYKKISTLNSDNSSYTHKKLTFNKNYYYKVRYSYIDENGKIIYSDFSISKKKKVVIPKIKPQVSIVNSQTLILSWDKVSGANSYLVYKCKNDDVSTCTKFKEIKNTSLKINNLKLGKKYYYSVKACRKDGKKNVCNSYSDIINGIVLPGKIKPKLNISNNTNLKIDFKKENDNINYIVGYKLASESEYTYLSEITSGVSSKLTISNLEVGKEYNLVFKTKYNGMDGLTTKSSILITPTPVTNIKLVKKEYNKIILTWDESGVENTKYIIYRSTDKKKYNKIATVSDNSYIDDGLSYNKKYYYKIKTLINGLKSEYSEVKNKKISIDKVKIKIKSVSQRNLELSLSEIEGATGYEIYRSTSKNGKYKKIALPVKPTFIDEVKFNEEYYYKARPIVIINGKRIYGDYSDIVSGKTVVSKPLVEMYESSRTSICFKVYSSYSTSESIYGTELYRSKKKDGEYKKIYSSYSNGEVCDNQFDIDKTYYYKIRTYSYKDYFQAKKVYSKYSNILKKYTEEYSGIVIQEDGSLAYKNSTFVINKDIEPGLYKAVITGSSATINTSFGTQDYWKYTYIDIPNIDGNITISGGKLVKISYDDIPVNINSILSNGIYIKNKNFEPGYYKLYLKDKQNAYYSSITTYTNLNSLESSINNKSISEFDNGLIFYIDDSIQALSLENVYLVKIDYSTNIKTELYNDCYIKNRDFEPGYYKLEFDYSDYEHDFSVYSNINYLNITPNNIVNSDDANGRDLNGKYFYIDDTVEEIRLINAKLTKVKEQINIKTTLTDGYYLKGIDFEPGYYIFNINENYYGKLSTFSKDNIVTKIDSVNVDSYNYDEYNGKVIYIGDNVDQIYIQNAKIEKIDLNDLHKDNNDGNGLLLMNYDISPKLYLLDSFDGVNDCNYSLVSINGLKNTAEDFTIYGSNSNYISKNKYHTLPSNIKYIEMNNCKIREVNEQTKFTPTNYKFGFYYLMNYSFDPGYYMVTNKNGINYELYDENFNLKSKYISYNQKYDLFYFQDNFSYLFMSSGSMVRVPYDEKIDDDTLYKYGSGSNNNTYIVGEDIPTGHYLVEWTKPEGDYNYRVILYDSENKELLDIFGDEKNKLIEISDDVYKVYFRYCTLKKVD